MSETPAPTDGGIGEPDDFLEIGVEGEILAGGVVTVRGSGTFVAVKEGHPAYHRW